MSLSSLSSVSVARTARDTPDQETDFEPTLHETTLADTVADTVVQHTLSFVSVERSPLSKDDLSKGNDSPQAFPEQVPVVAPTVHEQGPQRDPLEDSFAEFLAWKQTRLAHSSGSSGPTGQQRERQPRQESSPSRNPQMQRHSSGYKYSQQPLHHEGSGGLIPEASGATLVVEGRSVTNLGGPEVHTEGSPPPQAAVPPQSQQQAANKGCRWQQAGAGQPWRRTEPTAVATQTQQSSSSSFVPDADSRGVKRAAVRAPGTPSRDANTSFEVSEDQSGVKDSVMKVNARTRTRTRRRSKRSRRRPRASTRCTTTCVTAPSAR